MNKNKDRNIFSIIWSCCLFGLFYVMIVGFGIYMKGTNAYFGDPSYGSGSLGGEIYSVFYYRNWPNIDDVEVVENKKYNITKVLSYDEVFTSLDGYKFVGWNTSRDGSGNYYDVDYVFNLTADFNLYAQWRLIVAYGDSNEDGIVNQDDYLLIEKYLNGEVVLTDNGKINADVNSDGEINLVDVDIVKQANLGTVGYVGFLPNKPILIYDIYEGNIDIGDDKPNEDDKTDIDNNDKTENSDNNGNENISGNGSGNGQTGNGNESSGNGTGGKPNSGNNNSSGNVDNNTDENINNEDNVNDNVDNDIESDDRDENKLKFKFMNGNLEYSNSECLIEDGKCLLVLPKDNPKIDGYKFTGWSEDKECSSGKGIIKSVYVDSDKIYYACFVENKSYKDMYLLIIILCVCLVSFKLIWNLISNFKKENNNMDSSQ